VHCWKHYIDHYIDLWPIFLHCSTSADVQYAKQQYYITTTMICRYHCCKVKSCQPFAYWRLFSYSYNFVYEQAVSRFWCAHSANGDTDRSRAEIAACKAASSGSVLCILCAVHALHWYLNNHVLCGSTSGKESLSLSSSAYKRREEDSASNCIQHCWRLLRVVYYNKQTVLLSWTWADVEV
jgi:hypothetical protein